MAEQATVSGYRLSPQQEHVWALQQEAAAGVRYETECELVLEGEVEAGRLQRAIQEVVQEHEILRTKYRRLPEMKIPVQVIEAAGQVEFEQCELQGESALGTNGAGLQVQVMKAGAGNSVVRLRTGAINLDAIGMKNLVDMISLRYQAETETPHMRVQADELIQYADVSEIFNSLLEAEDMEQGREFWRAQAKAGSGGVKLP